MDTVQLPLNHMTITSGRTFHIIARQTALILVYLMSLATMQYESRESLSNAIKYAKESFARKPTKLVWDPTKIATLTTEELILPRRFNVGKRFIEIVGDGAVID